VRRGTTFMMRYISSLGSTLTPPIA
jgi:hypothetical protein